MLFPLAFNENPFHLLGATPEDNIELLAQRYKLAVATVSYDESFKISDAYHALSTEQPRIKAELAGVFDIEFTQVQALVVNLAAPLPREFSALSKVNILLNRFLTQPEMSEQNYQALIKEWLLMWSAPFEKKLFNQLNDRDKAQGHWSPTLHELETQLEELVDAQVKAFVPTFERFDQISSWLFEAINRAEQSAGGDRWGILSRLKNHGLVIIPNQLKSILEQALSTLNALWRVEDMGVKELGFRRTKDLMMTWVQLYPKEQQLQQQGWWSASLQGDETPIEEETVKKLLSALEPKQIESTLQTVEFLSLAEDVKQTIKAKNFFMAEVLCQFIAQHFNLNEAQSDRAKTLTVQNRVHHSVATAYSSAPLLYQFYHQVQEEPLKLLEGINSESGYIKMLGQEETINFFNLYQTLRGLVEGHDDRARQLGYDLTMSWFKPNLAISKLAKENRWQVLVAITELKALYRANPLTGEAGRAYEEYLNNTYHAVYQYMSKLTKANIPSFVIELILKQPDLLPEVERSFEGWRGYRPNRENLNSTESKHGMMPIYKFLMTLFLLILMPLAVVTFILYLLVSIIN